MQKVGWLAERLSPFVCKRNLGLWEDSAPRGGEGSKRSSYIFTLVSDKNRENFQTARAASASED